MGDRVGYARRAFDRILEGVRSTPSIPVSGLLSPCSFEFDTGDSGSGLNGANTSEPCGKPGEWGTGPPRNHSLGGGWMAAKQGRPLLSGALHSYIRASASRFARGPCLVASRKQTLRVASLAGSLNAAGRFEAPPLKVREVSFTTLCVPL